MLKNTFSQFCCYLSRGDSVYWEITLPIQMHLRKDSLLDALQYHDQLSHLQEADVNVRELVNNRREEVEAEDKQSSDALIDEPLRYVATQVHYVMEDCLLH